MRAVILGLLLLAGGLSGIVVVDADAATSEDVTTHGATCINFNASEARDVDHLASGVRNINAAARQVICAVKRHPVTGPGQAFFVDGSNTAGGSTSCTASSFSFTGVFQTSESFTESTAAYDRSLILETVSFFDYVSLLCTLPSSGRGVLFGVTAVDN